MNRNGEGVRPDHSATGTEEGRGGYVTYSRDVAGGQVSAAFPRIGPSWASVSVNVNSQEIGLYRRSLPEGRMAELARLLRESRYRELPVHPPMLPDTATLAVGEAAPGEELPRLAGFLLRDVPAALVPYVRAAEEAVEEVRAEPYRVVAGEARVEPAEMDLSSPLRLVVTMRNVGRESFTMDNPLRREAHGWLGLDVIVERLDSPEPGEVTDWLRVPLEPRHVSAVSVARTKVSAAGRIELAPGEGLCFRISRRFWLSPGMHRAAVAYTGTDNTNDWTVLEGELTMDAGRFLVRPGPKR